MRRSESDLMVSDNFGSDRNSQYENTPIQLKEIFSIAKIENFIGKTLIFYIFSLKTYNWWVHVRTASDEYQQCMFWTKTKIIRSIPMQTPVFLYESEV